MRFHPDTPILPTLEPYFACSDPMICSCTKFVRNGFSWYLHKSHPQSIDCPHHIDELMGLLMQSFNPTPLTATAISLEPMEVLHMLRQLSASEENRSVILRHPKLGEAMSHLLQGKELEKESIVYTFNLLLSILSPLSVPPLKIVKVKGATGDPGKEKKNTDYKLMLMESLPHLVPWLSSMALPLDELKEHRDAVLHMLQEKPGKIYILVRHCQCTILNVRVTTIYFLLMELANASNPL